MTLRILLFASLLLQASAVNTNAGFQDYARVPPPTTTAAVLAERQFTNYPPACTSWSYLISWCKSDSPGFVSMAITKQAPCLCYSSTNWVPQTFDAYVEECASWAYTADPTDYSIVAGWEGLCTSAGNVLNEAAVGATTTSPTTTSAPTATPDVLTNPGCSFVDFALSFCESVSPGFTDMAPSSKASCLCYSSTSWMPNSFDDQVSTCAQYAKSVDPSLYSIASDLENFCSSVGPIAAETTPFTATTATTTDGGQGNILSNTQPSQTVKNTALVSTSTDVVVVVSSSKSTGGVMPTGFPLLGWVQVGVIVELVVVVLL